ncbi:hypothetical protein [Granulicella sp. dw_53]|uniref:hypothetical protein n=1 Tax=Granulicella sp. dw_53 TaxID=2719792 RepID=UPI001BD28653|nr:hypothetical protein [Granulicella sp. dw_53]
MTPETLYRLAPPLIALQFLAFGWSVNRQINAAEADRQVVIPLPDVINIMSLFATVGCLIVLPIATESYFWLSRMVLGCAYVLIAFHPFTIAAHYRLWSRKGSSEKATDGASSPYVTHEELTTSFLSAVLAVVVAAYLRTH